MSSSYQVCVERASTKKGLGGVRGVLSTFLSESKNTNRMLISQKVTWEGDCPE